MAKLPTSELVAVAFGKRVLSLAGVTAPVATTLPAVTSWSSTGALQVEGIVGATIRERGLRDVIVSFGGWGARPGSDAPPYGQANGLLEFLVSFGTDRDWSEALALELEPAGVYEPVLVQAGHHITEPRRIPDQDTSRAHFSMDYRLIWGRR